LGEGGGRKETRRGEKRKNKVKYLIPALKEGRQETTLRSRKH